MYHNSHTTLSCHLSLIHSVILYNLLHPFLLLIISIQDIPQLVKHKNNFKIVLPPSHPTHGGANTNRIQMMKHIKQQGGGSINIHSPKQIQNRIDLTIPDGSNDTSMTSKDTKQTHQYRQSPIQRSENVLDRSITDSDITKIISFYHQESAITDNTIKGYRNIIGTSFQQLLNNYCTTNDHILNTYRAMLQRHLLQAHCMNTYFFYNLNKYGWMSKQKKFFYRSLSNCINNKSKPLLTHPNILIPIHIHGPHWVALNR